LVPEHDWTNWVLIPVPDGSGICIFVHSRTKGTGCWHSGI
jgi:hypothetical protein